MKLRASIVSAAVAAAAFGIAGCGSGSGNNYGSPMGPTISGGGGGATASDVSIVDYAFSPSSLTIKAGTTVTWTNTGSVAHTTTSNTGAWDSGQLSGSTPGGPYGGGSAGGTFQHTFTTAGTYSYHCSNHSSMTATITVTQ